MPYVPMKRQQALGDDGIPMDAGEFNFCLTWHMIHTDIDDLGTALRKEVEEYLTHQEASYGFYNEIAGVLDCCEREYRRRTGERTTDNFQRITELQTVAEEFYDRTVAPYEDLKIIQNGDCYP